MEVKTGKEPNRVVEEHEGKVNELITRFKKIK